MAEWKEEAGVDDFYEMIATHRHEMAPLENRELVSTSEQWGSPRPMCSKPGAEGAQNEVIERNGNRGVSLDVVIGGKADQLVAVAPIQRHAERNICVRRKGRVGEIKIRAPDGAGGEGSFALLIRTAS